jgi:hypothetical protein
MTLLADEFLRRFIQHVLPTGFVKVRHYGLLANRRREENLTQCRRLLLVETVRQRLPDATERAVGVAPVVQPCRRRSPASNPSRVEGWNRTG